MTHNTFYFRGKRINYQDEGQGNVLILLHGFMSSLDHWAPFVFSYMRENIRTIAIDLPGHGESESLDEINTLEDQALMIKELMDSLNINQCVMIGHSMGGYIMLAFAEKYSFYLRGLGLVHSQALADTEEGRNNRERMCNAMLTNRSGYIVDFMQTLFAPCNRELLHTEIKDIKDAALEMKVSDVIASQKGMMARPSRIDVLVHTPLPVLFVLGKQDPVIQMEMCLAQAMLPKHAQILLLDNVGHMSTIEAKEILRETIRSFVRTCNL